MIDLTATIFRAIPFDPQCAIQESYNKERRRWLKEQIEAYIAEQLAQLTVELKAKRHELDLELVKEFGYLDNNI